MKIFGLKNCDNCRKALKSIDSSELLDLRDTPVPAGILETAIHLFGDDIVNKRSTTWRRITEEEKLLSRIDLIRLHPTVMKRPLIVDGDQMYLGWGVDTRAALGVD